MSTQAISPAMIHANPMVSAPIRNPLQQRRDTDRRVLHLNNRACVLVLSNGEYSEAIKLFDAALMIHKEQTEEGSIVANIESATQSPAPTYPQHDGCDIQTTTTTTIDYSCHSRSERIYDDDDDEELDDAEDFSEEEDASDTEDYDDDDDEDDFGEMDWDEKEEDDSSSSVDEDDDIYNNNNNNNTGVPMASSNSVPQHLPQQQQEPQRPSSPLSPVRSAKIPRMTTGSRLRTLNYCGQQEYHSDRGLVDQHHYHHQVYGLPIVMEESEWDTAPIQDKTFVLIFNTALCNHLWGMQLMQQYIAATTASASSSSTAGASIAALAEHCRETLTIAKLLYKLALENSVSFANGVDKMCYVALYNNLSHVLKTLEGYDSAEAQWCDDMLLKAIFWWRDSTNHSNNNGNNNGNGGSSGASGATSSSSSSSAPSNNNTSSSNTLSDLYLDDDAEIIDAFLENVYYRVGVPENTVPAAAA